MKFVYGLMIWSTFSSAYIGCYGDSCTEFIATTNEHGTILKSTGVQYEWVGFGANSEVKEIEDVEKLKKITLYLGKSCDSFSTIYGKGTWSWANGGFVVTFEEEEFGFARQELEIKRENEYDCSM